MKKLILAAVCVAALGLTGCSSTASNGVRAQGALCAGGWCISPQIGVTLPPDVPPVIVQRPVVYEQSPVVQYQPQPQPLAYAQPVRPVQLAK